MPVFGQTKSEKLAAELDLVRAAGVDVLSLDVLLKRVEQKNDTTYVINFWATWCGPCIKELPYFDLLADKYSDKPIKVLLVSLDMTTGTQKRVASFAKNKNIQSELILLNESSPHLFIDRIALQWSGSIPATMVLNSNYHKKELKKQFKEAELSFEELDALVEPLTRTQ